MWHWTNSCCMTQFLWGMWHSLARCVLHEVFKQCCALEMSRPTYRMTEHNFQDDSHCQQHSCENLKSHKSPLPCMCWSPEVWIIHPFLMSSRAMDDCTWEFHVVPSHWQHCSERNNYMTGEKYIKVHWRGVNSLNVGQGARPWDITLWSWCSH